MPAARAGIRKLKTAYLSARPDMAHLLRYIEMGLNQAEAAKLLGIAPSNVRPASNTSPIWV
ncbi:phage anti-repressor protein [Neisseria mucosa]|uniref:hypothetical protein n=1 Tax=Neisseria mucosa TaxID=488 RepID=UPI000E014448|nr:hypothetical protein [Neisseria mucosa]SUA94159.1 phage anti-repressor protein [Neisseria mucosa]